MCEKESLDAYYSDIKHPNVNTFSLNDDESDLYVKSVSYSLDRTEITICYKNVKTIHDDILSGTMTVKTFAPGVHHAGNVLGVVLTALALNISEKRIIEGLANYKGITGRTNKRSKD